MKNLLFVQSRSVIDVILCLKKVGRDIGNVYVCGKAAIKTRLKNWLGGHSFMCCLMLCKLS